MELNEDMKLFSNKSVLVTGSCGTVGSELVRQLSASNVSRIICIDSNETDLFFQNEEYRGNERVTCHLGDVRDLHSLQQRMRGVDVVLHAAALKHVGLCEDSPGQAVATNILGTQNVIDAALQNRVGRVIFTSSDKAVNPTNVMGTSKLMGERLMTAAAYSSGRYVDTVFASTRFGNVLGSRGSVVPLFRQQIAVGGPITLTDRSMTRFVMTLEQAASLVLESVWMATGGEVMVTKMPVARIEDIAHVMRDELGSTDVQIVEIGSKPGEKMYEELMNEEEVRRSYEFERFLITLSPFSPHDKKTDQLSRAKKVNRVYNSAIEPPMSRNELLNYFKKNGVF